MKRVLKGKPVVEALKEQIKEKVESYNKKNIFPTIGIIRVGNREDDLAYERRVIKNCEQLGIKAHVFEMNENISMNDFAEEVKNIDENKNIHGILLFRPLPEQLDIKVVQELIRPEKDIDCMHPENLRKVFEGEEDGHYPCTPEAVVEILKYYDIPMKGSNIAIVNRSMVLGKPLSMMLIKENATVTICHSKTVNISNITKKANIVITGIGRPNFFTPEYFSKDNIVIDVGINYFNDKMCGDVDYEKIENSVQAITPVPGGVGTVTSTILLKHVMDALERLEN